MQRRADGSCRHLRVVIGYTAARVSATPATIRFYFDYESPNAYLAWTQLPKLIQRYGCTVDPVPILYAALLDAHGQLGPGEQPAKGRWMIKNLARKALLLGVPLNPPAFLPFNPLLALRVTLLASRSNERDALIYALFRAVWVRGLHVSETAVVERVANEVGLPGAALVRQTQSPEVKSRLRSQTDQAIARGVFGVPSMEVGDELFWGYDDFPHLELCLAGKDPIDPAEWAKRDRSVPASSVRRRFRKAKEDR
jgi:2-hydroxychromene-2-carboxylate isomerase